MTYPDAPTPGELIRGACTWLPVTRDIPPDIPTSNRDGHAVAAAVAAYLAREARLAQARLELAVTAIRSVSSPLPLEALAQATGLGQRTLGRWAAERALSALRDGVLVPVAEVMAAAMVGVAAADIARRHIDVSDTIADLAGRRDPTHLTWADANEAIARHPYDGPAGAVRAMMWAVAEGDATSLAQVQMTNTAMGAATTSHQSTLEELRDMAGHSVTAATLMRALAPTSVAAAALLAALVDAAMCTVARSATGDTRWTITLC